MGAAQDLGRRPYAAFGNSTGDQQILEYTKAGDGSRLTMLVLHDDAKREYAYGPAQGLPNTRVGTFTQALYDEAKKQGWVVISMKNVGRRFSRSSKEAEEEKIRNPKHEIRSNSNVQKRGKFEGV